MNEKHLGSTLDDFLAEEGWLDEADALAAQRVQRYQASTRFAPFDAADYLDDEETIAEYLAAASENPNPEVLRVAEQDVARARDRRREENATDARASIAAFQAGELKAYTAEELIAELHQSLEEQDKLPFGAAIPNAVTQRTFAETDAGEDIVCCDDAQDMFTRLGA
jgi:chromatin segregation and condensation protein Rec8/ScpA/Scc1 (kleisin family)